MLSCGECFSPSVRDGGVRGDDGVHGGGDDPSLHNHPTRTPGGQGRLGRGGQQGGEPRRGDEPQV